MALPGYYDNDGVYHPPGENDVDPSPSTTPTPTPNTGGGTTLAPFSGTFTPPQMLGLPSLPQVPNAPVPDLPTFKAPDPFKGVSIDAAMSDPSYLWRRDQGAGALERSAAARGILNDTGTAKALIDYNQNSASQEWQNVWNREYNTYNTNYQTQYVDPYKFQYQAALDRNAPAMAAWDAQNQNNRLGYTTEASWNQHLNDQNYASAWQQFLADWEMWKDRRDNEQSQALANPPIG